MRMLWIGVWYIVIFVLLVIMFEIAKIRDIQEALKEERCKVLQGVIVRHKRETKCVKPAFLPIDK